MIPLFLTLCACDNATKKKRSDVVMYGSSIFEGFFSFFFFIFWKGKLYTWLQKFKP